MRRGWVWVWALLPAVALAHDRFETPPASPLTDIPAHGYLAAHAGSHSRPLLGGPLKVHVTQQGKAFLVLPGPRALDPYVFGTSDFVEATNGVPDVNGVPKDERVVTSATQPTHTKGATLYSDRTTPVKDAQVKLDATDATATDASSSADAVTLDARWSFQGHTYALKCCSTMEHAGKLFPTFGGVATNQLVHGFTRIDSPLLPTTFADLAFWGKGELYRDGKQLEKDLPMSGTVGEATPTDPDQPAFDSDVKPDQRAFDLVVTPDIEVGSGGYTLKPVHTEIRLPDGTLLTGLHLRFEGPEVTGTRGR